MAVPCYQAKENYQMTNELNGQQPRPVVAGELGSCFSPPTPYDARERPLCKTDANGWNVVEADLQISFPRHRH